MRQSSAAGVTLSGLQYIAIGRWKA
jgi:hypothetical protein